MNKISKSILAAGMLSAIGLAPTHAFAWFADTTGFEPNGIVASPDGTSLYIATFDDGSGGDFGHSWLLVANTLYDDQITKYTPLFNTNLGGDEEFAYQVAVNKTGTLIFVLNTGTWSVDVIDQATNTQIATFSYPTVGQFPTGIRVSPNGKELWVANLETGFPGHNNGTVSVVSLAPANFGVPIHLINTGGSPNQIQFDKKGNHAYIQNLDGLTGQGSVDQVDAKNFKFGKRNLGDGQFNSPNFLAMDVLANDKGLYVADTYAYVNHIDIATNTVPDIIFAFTGLGTSLGPEETLGQLLVSPDQKYVVVALPGYGGVTWIPTTGPGANEYGGTDNLDGKPFFLAFYGTTLYYSEYNSVPVGPAPTGGNEEVATDEHRSF